MGGQAMTTPIMNVLDIIQQPPFVVGWQELDKFHRAIASLYEQQTKDDREAFLVDDYLSLILRHRMFGGTPQAKIQIIERNEQIQDSIEEIAKVLLSVARDLNTRLPDSFIEQCQKSSIQFYEIIRDVYITPAWKADNKTNSSTKSIGMGNNATENLETPPATKEMPQAASTQTLVVKRPRGRVKKEFEDFFHKSDDAEKMIPILQELLDGKFGRDAARIIVACYKGGWIKEQPTAASIVRKFGIADSGLKEHFKCHFHYSDKIKLKYKPFTDEELTPIVEDIKKKITP